MKVDENCCGMMRTSAVNRNRAIMDCNESGQPKWQKTRVNCLKWVLEVDNGRLGSKMDEFGWELLLRDENMFCG